VAESNDRPRADGNNRRASLHSALWFLRDGRSRTTPELAALLNVTPSTALRLTQTLIAAGLVCEAAQVPSGAAGRPAKSWQLRAEAGHVLGLSTFPEEITAVVADLSGRIVGRRTVEAETRFTAVNLPWAVGEVARDAMEESGVDDVLGAGIAMPGVIDPDEGLVRVGWHFRWSGTHVYDYPIREAFEQALHCPVALENDANACAVAAHFNGVATGILSPSDAVVYWLALPRAPAWYGGFGLAIGGAPYQGSRHAAGEMFQNQPPMLGDDFHGGIAQRAMAGDEGCARRLAQALRPSVRFMLCISLPLDPAHVIFGGSHTVLGRAMEEVLEEEMLEFREGHAHIVPVACPAAVLDPLWPNTIELGAARTILDKLFLADHATLEDVLLERVLSA